MSDLHEYIGKYKRIMLLTEGEGGVYSTNVVIGGGQDGPTGFNVSFFLSPEETKELGEHLIEHSKYMRPLQFCSCTERPASVDECEIHGKARS